MRGLPFRVFWGVAGRNCGKVLDVQIVRSPVTMLCGPCLPVLFPRPVTGPVSLSRRLRTDQSDVGSVTPPGTLAYDPASRIYTIDSAGANLWSTVDAFHFVWKKVSGDLSLTADIQFPQTPAGASPHRKALLMFRQTLDPDALYADAAIHGNGETALQYRRNKGDTTQGIEFNIGAPKTLRLEKRGDTITLFVSMHGEPLHQAGASIKLHLEEPFYAGIGACAHNKDAVETGHFCQPRVEAAHAARNAGQARAL